MIVQILIFLPIICFISYYYIQKRLNYFKNLDIPHMPPIPIFGNMLKTALRRTHINDFMREVYNFNPAAKYIGLYNFMEPVIVIRDEELIKSIAIKNFDHFIDHRPILTVGNDPLYDGSLFNLTGERWRESRNLLTPSFTSSKLKGMFGLMIEVAENFTDHMSLQAQDPNNVLNTKDLFTRFTSDLIATCAFGINVDSLKNPNNEFYLMGRKATKLDGIVLFKFMLSRASPILSRILKLKFMDDEIMQYYVDIVSTTIATRKEKEIFRPDMLQLMMEAQENENGKIKLDIIEMTAHAFTFFFAGSDTTSTQMCFIAHELAVNSDIQKNLQNEIDEVLNKTNGKPTYDAINGMDYLDVILKESLRHHSQIPFLGRVCAKDFELPPALPGCKPYLIKAGMDVWIPTPGVHMDPKYYENPKQFDPDRYNRDKKVNTNDAHNLGFGIGPRSCIGNRFAILEIKILIFYLLAKFNLKPNEKTGIPLEYNPKSFILTVKSGFWLTIEPRKL